MLNEIKSMLGQMIIIGIRGTSKDDAKAFFELYDEITVGGIILYDQNVTTNPWTSHNIITVSYTHLTLPTNREV